MMKFTPIASSSKGNAYLLEADGVAPLLLEAGLPIKQLREKLNFGLTELAGCLISHEHQDHSKAVNDLIRSSVNIYASPGTGTALKISEHYRFFPLTDDRVHSVGRWSVIIFPLEHDAAEPIGFMVGLGDERLLFIPDTAFIENRFSGITLISIECNHIEGILSENIAKGHIDPALGRRVRRNHMSLEQVIALLKANDLSRCRIIYLLHLSNTNSDERKMIEEVQRATGIPTIAC